MDIDNILCILWGLIVGYVICHIRNYKGPQGPTGYTGHTGYQGGEI